MTPLPHHYKVRATGAATSAPSTSTPRACRNLALRGTGRVRRTGRPVVTRDAAGGRDRRLLHPDVSRRRARRKLEWLSLDCENFEGTLERVEGVTSFTRYVTRARLRLAPGADAAKARELLERAERGCLVANSLRGTQQLEIEIVDAAG